MKWLKSWKIRSKITFSFCMMVVFMIVILMVSLLQLRIAMDSVTYAIRHPIQGQLRMSEFRCAVIDFRRISATIPAFAYQGDTAQLEAYAQLAAATFDAATEALDEFENALRADPRVSPEFVSDVLRDTAEKRRLLDAYLTTVYTPLIAAARAGDAEAADAYLVYGLPIADTLAGKVDDIVALAASVAATSLEGAAQDADATFWRLIILTSVIAVTSVGTSFYIGADIAKPMAASEEALRAIIYSLETATVQVTGSASAVADASTEQAASVQQTSATIDETSVLVDKTAEDMRVAAALSLQFKQSADSSREKLQKLVGTMHELSKSSGAIAKIAKTIDDIAFQTNLLAINATVEAARAGGDSGRSFGVVAEEVRNLSQRSAKSASEATEIIQHDVALVSANEKISLDVAKALEEIIAEFEKLDVIIHEVDKATEDEAAGIKQINVAMRQIERSTQSNAAASQEGAASAEMLTELVGDLGEVYKDVHAAVHGRGALR